MPSTSSSDPPFGRRGASEPAADVERIRSALVAAAAAIGALSRERLAIDRKAGGDPVTEADRAADAALRGALVAPGEGWLSEETEDDPARLACRRVWVVDPIDGTRQFVDGVPEWCISVALVEDGRAVAGGTCNPATGETFLGHVATGASLGGIPIRVTARERVEGAVVLASRSETRRGEWERFRDAPFRVRSVGSVAYKLSLVAAGRADATWSLVPKHEWDVAAGVALVRAAGGAVLALGGGELVFNQAVPRVPGLLAAPSLLAAALRPIVGV